MEAFDVVIIGAGAAGMMCAAAAARRGRTVLVIDAADAPGEKIRISGGGRCNFTNRHTTPAQFLSANPSFCISALSRYTQHDFIALVDRHGIAWHEKTLGQLFCDGPATQIVAMLRAEMADARLRLKTRAGGIEKTSDGFSLRLSDGESVTCASLVVATGGKSIPKMGATDFGYRVAAQFDVAVTETRAGLAPLTFDGAMLERLKPLAGVALPARVMCGKTSFDESLLITHRGLSGPAILQISSYWREDTAIAVNLLPGVDALAALRAARQQTGKQSPHNFLATLLPRRLAREIAGEAGTLQEGTLADLSDARLKFLAARINDWRVMPSGTEGYRTAEVTLGGVDTRGLDSRTMQAKSVPGLYFIGEVVDVTGWLGGYNFQWAWSSGWCAGQAV